MKRRMNRKTPRRAKTSNPFPAKRGKGIGSLVNTRQRKQNSP